MAPGEVNLNYCGPLLRETCQVYEATGKGGWTRRGQTSIKCAVQDSSGATAVSSTGEVTRQASLVFLEAGTPIGLGWQVRTTAGRRMTVQAIDRTTNNPVVVVEAIEVKN